MAGKRIYPKFQNSVWDDNTDQPIGNVDGHIGIIYLIQDNYLLEDYLTKSSLKAMTKLQLCIHYIGFAKIR